MGGSIAAVELGAVWSRGSLRHRLRKCLEWTRPAVVLGSREARFEPICLQATDSTGGVHRAFLCGIFLPRRAP